MCPSFLPPQTEMELMERASALAGKSIGEIAQQLQLSTPDNLKIKKGWQGQLIEKFLGADSGNLSQPDFNHLGIELKTLPIDLNGRVLESTYVCVVNLNDHQLLQWQQSSVYKKLNHVLWVPIAKHPNGSTADSRIATPFLWQPTPQQIALLQSDWEHVMNLVSLGQVDKINARQGEILQVRPKAAHSKVTTETVGKQGEKTVTLPRGFYLRASFTQQLLQSHLKIN